MDEGLSRAVQTIFKRLYDDGLIYRAERIINWCPRCLTALSDIEVEHTDDDGELVSIRYGDGDDSIVVATTRAETMLGDTAVAVHPDDERYRHLIGTEVELPLTGRRIPIVADAHVDPAFGTGAVKVTPAHDPNDFEIGQRHDLPSLTDHGRARRDHRARPVRGAGPVRGAARRSSPRCASRAGSSRRSGRTCTRSGTARGARPRSSRGCRCSGSSTPARWPRRPATRCATAGSQIEPRRAGQALLRLGRQHARLVHLPPAVVGAPDPGLVRPGRRGRLRRPGRGAADRRGLAPGRGRARHLVLLGAVAVLHARLARRDRRTWRSSTRPACWSPATTSCSSGSPG